MDPLSVIASVAGIITAASEAIKILGPYVTATKDAPKVASQVLSEVLAVKTIVAALELFAATLASSTGPSRVQYASLVQVDQLVAVLTDGVLVFSELDALLQTLSPTQADGSRARLLSSMQWVRKKGALSSLCTRLQAFKLSINCILSILQSDSQVRAEDHQKQLLLSMDTLLKNNEALAHIFLGANVAHTSVTWSQRTSIQPSSPNQGSEMQGRNRRSVFDLPFEKDLIASRVYRRIKRDTMDFSARSSVTRSHGWSIFSGMSLSDISEISVLALPIHPSDISNPQHYVEGPESRQAGELSVLPASAYGSSIFHECVELEAQLLQLAQCSFKQALEHERIYADASSSDPLSLLISLFRSGGPLLQLYDQLDDSYHGRWKSLLYQALSPSSVKLAVVEFIQACVTSQGIPTADCFTVTDLMDDDTTNHVKVIRLVRRITSRLVDARVIKPVDIESLPELRAPEGPPSLAPQLLAIEELVREERVYVARLECLLEARDRLLTSHGIVLAGTALNTANNLLAESRKLIDGQRRFLLQLEGLALRPYGGFDLPWLQLFRNWGNISGDLYTRFVSGQHHAKSGLKTAIARLSPATGVPELQNVIGDAISGLSMPSHRLGKYRAFLEEIAQYDDTVWVKEAMDVVDEVVAKSRAAKDDVDRNDAKATLLLSLDAPDQHRVAQYGDLLLFEDAASVNSNIDGSENDPLARLYLFEKAFLYVALAKKRGGFRPAKDGRIGLSIVRSIWGENMRLINKRPVTPHWVRDSYDCGGGFEIQALDGKLFIHLAVDSLRDKWVRALMEVRDKCQEVTRFWLVPHYKLAAVGGMGSGRERFTRQFLAPHSPEEYLSEGWLFPNPDADSKPLFIGNETYNLEILGPSAQEEYSAMRYDYMRKSDGFLLIYSVADRNSFEDILVFQQQILRVKDKDSFPMIVVGNDCMQLDGGRARQVSAEEGRALANQFGCPFLEADAVTGDKVEEAFVKLAQEVKTYQLLSG